MAVLHLSLFLRRFRSSLSNPICQHTIQNYDDESGGLSRFQRLAETAGVHGHTRSFPDFGSSGHRCVIRGFYRFLHRFGKACRVHRHAGDGSGRIGHHLRQAAWRSPQQTAGKGYLCLQESETQLVKQNE